MIPPPSLSPRKKVSVKIVLSLITSYSVIWVCRCCGWVGLDSMRARLVLRISMQDMPCLPHRLMLVGGLPRLTHPANTPCWWIRVVFWSDDEHTYIHSYIHMPIIFVSLFLSCPVYLNLTLPSPPTSPFPPLTTSPFTPLPPDCYRCCLLDLVNCWMGDPWQTFRAR